MNLALTYTILGIVAAVVGTTVGLVQLWEKIKRNPNPSPGPRPQPNPILPFPTTFYLESPRSPGFSAKARKVGINSDFVVLKGSTAKKENRDGLGAAARRRREQLVRDGKLVDNTNGSYWVFIDDFSFSSPSAAAEVVLGRSASGNIEWRVEGNGQTYGEWEKAIDKK